MLMTPGEILRKKREKEGLSLEQVAEETNIRTFFLQAIEEDRLGSISSQTQMRGFTRLYASYLGIDPHELFESSTPPLEQLASIEDHETSVTQVVRSLSERTSILDRLKRKKESQPPSEFKIEEAVPEKNSDVIFQSIGRELMRQREALGLSRNDIERQIKIRELYVYALETGQIDDLPSTVQGRGMLNNYAAFMSLDPEPLQLRFVEGLQQRRIEKNDEELEKKKSGAIKKFNAPITGWRRYLTPDLLVVGSVFAVLVILVIWGALQVIGSSQSQIEPTAESISSILIATETPAIQTSMASSATDLTTTPNVAEVENTVSVDLMATINSMGNKPIQVVVIAYQRAFLKIVSDNKEVFTGRVVPGGVYTFSGTTKITLTTGNASAIQVYYNQLDLGILGGSGQVINMDFTSNAMVTSTPAITTVPTSTFVPTYTQQSTSTPTSTSTPVVPTITPYRP